MASNGCVDSLVNSCLYLMVKHLGNFDDAISTVPANIKDRLILLMSKRGLVTDGNILSCTYPNLKELDLSECDVSDLALKNLASAKVRLIKIDLNSAKGNRKKISSNGVISLSEGCPYLQTVYLRRCVNVTDDAVIALAKNCPKLKQLNLGGCPKITDESLFALGSRSENLESLNISSMNVTDDGIFKLCSGHPRLTLSELHINQCAHLTDASVEVVTRLCPCMKILLLHGCPLMTDAARIAMDSMSDRMKQVTWTIY